MTVIYWLGNDGMQRLYGGTVSPFPMGQVIYLNGVTRVRSQPVRQPMQFVLDDLRRALAKAKAPIAILVAAIRDALRCVPRLAAALPTSRCSSRKQHRPRRRDIRHGDALLNVHRMPA